MMFASPTFHWSFIKKKWSFSVSIILGLLLLTACLSPHQNSDLKALADVETILVLPFQSVYEFNSGSAGIDCEFCERRHAIGEISEADKTYMTEHLIQRLMDDKAYRFNFIGTATAGPTHPVIDRLSRADINKLIASVGDPGKADAILVGYLFRFKERVGASYAIESPASVSLSLFLLRMDDGRVVWHSHFEETQQSLFENLLKIGAFIRRKARWLTARELAADGLQNMLSRLPKP
jgi:hypothetical protein